VLEEAQDPSVPLLERVKFLAIFSSNLDEFFMVRVAELKRQIRAGDLAPGPDGLSPAETLAAIAETVHHLVDAQHRCFLRPGIPGLSDRIRVISIVDRYLEHARAFYFQNAGAAEYWLASADWMPRNLDHRVEIAFPVLDPRLQAQIHEVLELQLRDTVKAREVLRDGRSTRVRAVDTAPLRSQERLYALVAEGRS
jgi:polyphosphate kinase